MVVCSARWATPSVRVLGSIAISRTSRISRSSKAVWSTSSKWRAATDSSMVATLRWNMLKRGQSEPALHLPYNANRNQAKRRKRWAQWQCRLLKARGTFYLTRRRFGCILRRRRSPFSPVTGTCPSRHRYSSRPTCSSAASAKRPTLCPRRCSPPCRART